MAAVLPGLPTTKVWRKVVVKILECFGHPFQRHRIHHPAAPPDAFAILPISPSQYSDSLLVTAPDRARCKRQR